MLGTMIETPRAALVADSIGKQAEFFSFGTNDLTQMTLGFSRDDAGKFLPDYLKQGMYEHDPFRSIDQKGVGLLVQMAVQKGRSACGRRSKSACAASMAATRRRWPSSTAQGWTTSAARPSACPSPGWPRRRRRWLGDNTGRRDRHGFG
jgi:hypothetical protein